MGMFDSFNINASGMSAQRYRMDIISENIANANTTRTEDGTPYRRRTVVFAEKSDGVGANFGNVFKTASNKYKASGVKVTEVVEDTWTPMNKVYDPSHPDADENGYVHYPNVNSVTEMTNLIDASRAYEANASAFNAAKTMAMKGLELGK